jgi:hypothetical protein
MSKIEPRNKMAQVLHRATGNPVNTLPISAISNCFPGLEYDFKNFWRRAFVGIVLLEWDNYVVEVEDKQYKGLLHHRLLTVDGRPVVTTTSGPQIPGGTVVPLPAGAPGVVTMEWSNSLAYVMRRQGHEVHCQFSAETSDAPIPVPSDASQLLGVDMTVRTMLEPDVVAIAEGTLHPGELTQGLCSPWQHDYRECACYYWPASRPDYVNVEPGVDGVSRGDNWMSKGDRPGEYILDDRRDSRLVTYEDLFREWERMLRFQVKGHDAEESS